ncbi:hypothetical protein M0R45_012787 [Rubus argutus]|uniref:phosphatidate cytidylyltransferase n=1 Tax=Rubus argutus TaxID=59490 RepID=A0AAW1XH77_RUBAR
MCVCFPVEVVICSGSRNGLIPRQGAQIAAVQVPCASNAVVPVATNQTDAKEDGDGGGFRGWIKGRGRVLTGVIDIVMAITAVVVLVKAAEHATGKDIAMLCIVYVCLISPYYCITAMVVVIEIFMAKELFNLLRKVHEEMRLPGFRLLNWHFFFTAMLFVYGRMLSQRLVNTSSFTVANIPTFVVFPDARANCCRFLLPATLIVINDIAAYICGFFFGRTPLIKISPKKTWEGFIGSSITTMFSAFWLANVMGRFQWPTCPRKFPWKGISIFPVQWHALCLGLFSSIIAPFGGFFASGFKRAFKVKVSA